jgi:carbamoyl-phosphate synthase large subunit
VDRAHPVLIDRFLDEATEVDVDCVADFGGPNPSGGVGRCVVCGVMEHIEEAGIHSGDSSCALPPYSLPPLIVDELVRQTEVLARRLNVCGLMNVQFAVKHNAVYVLEVNPRASRTVPFVSKATGTPWARIATRVLLGESLDDALRRYGLTDPPEPRHVSVKSVVFPFNRFPGVDCVLGPEMRSTGEVMGVARNFPLAFAKAMEAAGCRLPTGGAVLVSVNDTDKPAIVMIAQQLAQMGFRIVSTKKTRETLLENGIEASPVSKTQDAAGPYLIDLIREGRLDLLINTPIHWGSATHEGRIRAAAVRRGIPLITTIAGARAAVSAIRALRRGPLEVRALQDYFEPRPVSSAC